MTPHVDDRRLHAYLDDELDRAARSDLEAHAAGCPACARRLAALAEVRTALDTLPRAARPALDLWPAIAARLERAADVVPLPVARAAPGIAAPEPRDQAGPEAAGAHQSPSLHADAVGKAPLGPRRSRGPWPLAYAAGLLLAFAAGALTWTVLGPVGSSGDAGAAAGAVAGGLPVPDDVPATGRLAAVSTYQEAILDLEALLAEGRSRLDPATVRTLEESLATIDRAIADAEVALRADPDSDLLRGMLLGQQRAKYRVLSRAAGALLPRT